MVRYKEIIFLVLITVIPVDSWLFSRRRSCSRRNCRLSQWSQWTQCTDSCGSFGSQTRYRRKLVTESCGGSCSTLHELRGCNLFCCPVDCTYNYGSWGLCSVTCGTGVQEKQLNIISKEKCNGRCSAPKVKTRSCNTNK